MLFKTYQKITTLFKEHHGYMSFADLRDHQVTVLQLAEMEEEGSLERFARGWYWCKDCGYEKPEDYQYTVSYTHLDVYKRQPYTFITSHIAWQPKAARLRAVDLAVKNFRSYLEGMPTSVIN